MTSPRQALPTGHRQLQRAGSAPSRRASASSPCSTRPGSRPGLGADPGPGAHGPALPKLTSLGDVPGQGDAGQRQDLLQSDQPDDYWALVAGGPALRARRRDGGRRPEGSDATRAHPRAARIVNNFAAPARSTTSRSPYGRARSTLSSGDGAASRRSCRCSAAPRTLSGLDRPAWRADPRQRPHHATARDGDRRRALDPRSRADGGRETVSRPPAHRFGLVDWDRLYRDAAEVLGRLDFSLDVKQLVPALGAAARQVTEIARALLLDAKT